MCVRLAMFNAEKESKQEERGGEGKEVSLYLSGCATTRNLVTIDRRR